MKGRLVFGLCLAVLAGACSVSADPAGWMDAPFLKDNDQDYGKGTVAYDESGGKLAITMQTQGMDVWAKRDSGHYAYTSLSGDGEIIATLPLPDPDRYYEWAKAGLMLRGYLMPDAPMVFFARVPSAGGYLQPAYRSVPDGDTAGFGTGAYAFSDPMRMRLARQGDLFSVWISTNAPAYDAWMLHAQTTVAGLPETLFAGVFGCRHTKKEEDWLTVTFSDVQVHPFATAAFNSAGNAEVKWRNDFPLEEGESVTGFTVSRLAGDAANFVTLTATPLSETTFTHIDTSVEEKVLYRYRVTATVARNGETSERVIATTMPIRKGNDTTNAHPAPLKGLQGIYMDSDGGFLGSRVDPQLNDPWGFSGSSVFPANAAIPLTRDGSNNPINFTAYWNGSLTVPKTGVYHFRERTDDRLKLFLDGVQLTNQTEWEQGRTSSANPMWLEAGRRYPLNAWFLQGGGGVFLTLSYLEENSATETVIPQAWFEPFPMPWSHSDLGQSPLFGNATYDASARRFTVYSGGAGFAAGDDGADDLHAVWTETDAEKVDLLLQVDAMGKEAGAMIRASRAPRAAMAAVVLQRQTDNLIKLFSIRRTAEGGAAVVTQMKRDVTLPVKLRVSRSAEGGNGYLMCETGTGWEPVAVKDLPTGPALFGFGASSRDITTTDSATFSGISFVTGEAFNSPISVTVSEHKATVWADSWENAQPFFLRQADAAKPYANWSWADTLARPATYQIYRYADLFSDGEIIGTINREEGLSFTDPETLAPKTVTIYQVTSSFDFGKMDGGAEDPSVEPFLSNRYGVSDGVEELEGTGLTAEVGRTTTSAAMPVYRAVDPLTAWDKASGNGNTLYVSATKTTDEVAVGPDNFHIFWTGYLYVPVTGEYVFRFRHDDTMRFWLDGRQIYNATYLSTAYYYSEHLRLEAGKRYPVLIYFDQGTGGGFFDFAWQNGLGVDAETFTAIPATSLYPLAEVTDPIFLGDETEETFGAWRNTDINTGCPGHVMLNGDENAFDALIIGGGADIWGGTDGLHYLYQKIPDGFNFSIEATIDMYDSVNEWQKVGIMLRAGLNEGARNFFIFQSRDHGRVWQWRNEEDGTSVGTSGHATTHARLNADSSVGPVTFRFERQGGKIKTYLNGTYQVFSADNGVTLEDYEIRDWKDLYVGLVVTAHDNARLQHTFFKDVKFTISRYPGSVMILK